MKKDIFIPGVNQNKIKIIMSELGIEKLEEFKKAAKQRRLRKLKGLGSKTEMEVLRGIKLLEEKPFKLPIGIALEFAETLINNLLTWSEISQVLLVGELRRGVEEVNKIELLLEANPRKTIDKLNKHPYFCENLQSGEEILIFKTRIGLPVILHFALQEEWGTKSIITTGSKKHLQDLREICPDLPSMKTEKKVYNFLNLSWIPPEIRETGLEIKYAERNILSKFVSLKDIKGDLHLHSKWSDGINTIEEIVQNAVRLGYEYLAITDHSQSLKVAGGLNAEDLHRQATEIDKIQAAIPKIRILKGIEVDILDNGDLDLKDDILLKMDVVIASVHTHFHMNKIDMTKRIAKALTNPYVHILAHPTGRILGKRKGYDVDIDYIMDIARKNRKVLEINASPDRLDLRDKHLIKAKKRGLQIAINTDAHDILRMNDIKYGVQTAVRGWQESKDIINSWKYNKLANFLKNRRDENEY